MISFLRAARIELLSRRVQQHYDGLSARKAFLDIRKMTPRPARAQRARARPAMQPQQEPGAFF